MNRPRSRALTAKQVNELLAGSPTPDTQVSGAVMATAYRFDDDRELLVFEDGKGRLYESRAALLAMMDQVATQSATNPAAALGPDFPDRAPALAADLGIKSLPEVDDLIRRLGPQTCLGEPTFAQLVAFAGEFIRAERGGRWHVDGEPYLTDAAGTTHRVASIVYKELSEWDQFSSLAGAVHGQIGSRRLSE